MARKKYLRIANRNPVSARGYFPRRYLRVVGATTKRGQESDEAVGGQFGSGKKYAPVAALALGMDLHITSHDAKGPYLYSYATAPDPDGEPFDVVVMRSPEGEEQALDVSADACRNWQESIGDDPMKSYHVLREYMRDARDADPKGPHLSETDLIHQAVTGTTSTYLTMTDEIGHMLTHKDRYFKYLLKDLKPVYRANGVGAIYPKSEEGVTRLFSQGSMALCSKAGSDATLYDYSFDSKKLLSEERNFRSISAVRSHLAVMLASIDSVELAKVILHGMLSGKAPFEEYALASVGSRKIPGAAAWRTAWASLWPGKKPVMSSFVHMYDEYAKTACGRTVVTVTGTYLRGFLKRCGVQSSDDLYPKHLKNSRVVTPTAGQRANLDEATRILAKYGLIREDYEVFVYVPILKGASQPDLGFCVFAGEGRGIYILQSVTDDLLDTIETLYHEHCHARTGAVDGSRAFDDRKDSDIGRLLYDLEGIDYPEEEEEEEEELEFLELEEDAVSDATRKSLDLILRMIEEAEPEPPD